jgi:hypothetical protein
MKGTWHRMHGVHAAMPAVSTCLASTIIGLTSFAELCIHLPPSISPSCPVTLSQTPLRTPGAALHAPRRPHIPTTHLLLEIRVEQDVVSRPAVAQLQAVVLLVIHHLRRDVGGRLAVGAGVQQALNVGPQRRGALQGAWVMIVWAPAGRAASSASYAMSAVPATITTVADALQGLQRGHVMQLCSNTARHAWPTVSSRGLGCP